MATTKFVHPGILINKTDLEQIKAKVAAKQEPWAAGFTRLQTSGMSSVTPLRPKAYRFSSLDYPPCPVPQVRCWTGTGQAYAAANPQLNLTETGCREQTDDAIAAYAHALQWYVTGDVAYAKKAIEIMNAWSSVLKEILFDQPRTNTGAQIWGNGKLQAGWTASIISRAAEIIRYTNAGWAVPDIERFSTMLTNVFLPLTISSWSSQANWLTTLAEATINIGVFTNDGAAFDAGVAQWRQIIPTTIYLSTDGPTPIPPNVSTQFDTTAEIAAYWYKPARYINGLQQETGRDLSHMMMGLGAMSNAAATAGIQGLNLFGEHGTRIAAGYELNAGFVNQYLDEVARLGKTPPTTWRPTGWVNPNFNLGGQAYKGGWEVVYKNYGVRLGIPMPNTLKLIKRLQPTGTALHLSWETLTHGN